MKRTLRILAAALLLMGHTAYAKEIAVLLPVTGPLTPNEQAELTGVVVAGLSSRFELKHGAEVERVVRQAFQEESKKQDCDEANCYRLIAGKYQAEKIIALRVVAKKPGHYLLALQIYDVPAGEMTFSQKKECDACSFQTLRDLSGDLIKRVPAP